MTEVEQMIEDCLNRESKLNDWEHIFIDSISKKGTGNLTQMQLAKLDEIWNRIT